MNGEWGMKNGVGNWEWNQESRIWNGTPGNVPVFLIPHSTFPDLTYG